MATVPVHFMRNALAHAGKGQRRIVSAWIGTAFAEADPDAARTQWRNVADQLRGRGTVQRDLFSEDRGGWITDAALLERLVAEHMERAAEAIRAEGWKWVEVGLQAPEACWRLRRIMAHEVPLSDTDAARRLELTARYDALAEQHEGDAEVPTRSRPSWPRASRNWTRSVPRSGSIARRTSRAGASGGRSPELPKPRAPALSAASESELEAHRMAGLQAEFARQPELALLVLLHGLATDAFYGRYGETVVTLLVYRASGSCGDRWPGPASHQEDRHHHTFSPS